MAANYNKLWKILIDRNIRKEDLRVAAGITTTALLALRIYTNIGIQKTLLFGSGFVPLDGFDAAKIILISESCHHCRHFL